jgi:hypothetical protein
MIKPLPSKIVKPHRRRTRTPPLPYGMTAPDIEAAKRDSPKTTLIGNQLDEAAAVVSKARKKSPARSASSRLPPTAGQIVREALPALLLEVDARAWELGWRAGARSGAAMAARRRSYTDAIEAATKARAHLDAALDNQPWVWDRTAVGHRSEAYVRLELLQKYLEAQLDHSPKPARGPRQDPWLRAFLEEMAYWWIGTQPETKVGLIRARPKKDSWPISRSANGAFLCLARLVIGFHRGTRVKKLNDQAVRTCLFLARARLESLKPNIADLVRELEKRSPARAPSERLRNALAFLLGKQDPTR